MRYVIAFGALFWIWLAVEIIRAFPPTGDLTTAELAHSN